MRFDYTASDRSGAKRRGKIEASNIGEARKSLEQLGMQVLDLQAGAETGSYPRVAPKSAGPPSGSFSRPDLPKSAGPPSGAVPRPELPKSAGPPSGAVPRPDLPKSAGPPRSRPSGAGSSSSQTRPDPARSSRPGQPVKAKATSPSRESLLSRLDWRRLAPFLAGLLLLIVVASLFFLNQPRKMEVTLKGNVSVARGPGQKNAVASPYDNLTVYVYFPDQKRLVSAKGVAEPTGKRWKGIKDPNHSFKLDVQPDGKYELKLAFTASSAPRRCTLTINKPGYSSSKKRGLSIQRDGSSLVAMVTNSSLRLRRVSK